MQKRTRNVLIAIGVFLVSIVVGGALFFYISIQRSEPVVDAELSVTGVDSKIEISLDSLGIPTILAQTERDACFGLGYQHAADRMFQMDLARHVSQGRLSELLGAFAGGAVLPVDVRQRIIGHSRMAREAESRLDDVTRGLLQSYADGVNAYRNNCRSLTFEYTLLGVEFNEWTVYDCLSILSFQSWFSDAIQNQDQFFISVAEKVGVDKARTLMFDYPDWAPYTVPSHKKLGMRGDSNTDPHLRVGKLSHIADEFASNTSSQINFDKLPEYLQRLVQGDLSGLGLCEASNGWVVAPSRTKSGGAILAGDPHLDITRLPQFWYIAATHVTSTGSRIAGITTPGLPFYVMGANGICAWTMTAAGIDLVDYYAEEVNPNDTNQYRTPDGWANFERIPETLYVASVDTPIIFNVKKSRNGLIEISDDSLDHVYALRWAGQEADLVTAAQSGFALSHTRDFEQFRQTVTSLGALNGNWIYADSAGNIGYQLGAPIPIRSDSVHPLFYKGWENSTGWTGYRSLDETPHAFNPSQGWLANCNNKQDQPNLQYPLYGSFFADRILRLQDHLQSNSSMDVATTQHIQTEWNDEYFRRWAVELAPLLDSLGVSSRANDFRNWDGAATTESRVLPVVAEFIYQLREHIFQDELGNLTSQMKRIWVDQAYHTGADFWFDNINTDSVETRSQIALSALQSAIDSVGPKTWGEINSLEMGHLFAGAPGITGFLDLQRGPWPRGGSGGSINASYYREEKSGLYNTIAGPSWRFVIDMSDPENCWMAIPGGQSGNPISEHFFDFYALWNSNTYWPVTLDPERALSRRAHSVTLNPAADSASSE